MNILQEIAGYTALRVEQNKRLHPLEELKERAEAMSADTGFPFEQALSGEGIHFICECKKASPSKGLIAESFPYLEIAKAYEAAGASAISCLTEPKWFRGSDQYLQEIVDTVSIPVLRKDFTVDPYMIYEAKLLGASAVLLICSLLDADTLAAYLELTYSLGLSALVEAHDEKEVRVALQAGAGIIGVNNRNLKTFEVNIENAVRLRQMVPQEVLFVAESGIRTAEDVAVLYQNGTNAVLIGETLMRSADKGAMIAQLQSKCFPESS
ncbi:MAG: indole-3-glycerol phosphate synthase TrpC [Eubacterium sp.]|nr:indole-3-glycerol phosphate synthase TrpC [Eubacterium sp.]